MTQLMAKLKGQHDEYQDLLKRVKGNSSYEPKVREIIEEAAKSHRQHAEILKKFGDPPELFEPYEKAADELDRLL